jgi:hypothetical protein
LIEGIPQQPADQQRLGMPSPINTSSIWHPGLVAPWLASAANSIELAPAIAHSPSAANPRIGRTMVAGGDAATAPSSRRALHQRGKAMAVWCRDG